MEKPTAASWRVIAHRGGSHLRPENTLLAFRHAVEIGVDALEMDVRATRDGQLVVMHDPAVDRTTDGFGTVADLTLAEIRSLDAGFNWPLHTTETDHPYRGSGAVIPTLEEILVTFPDVPMVIDIKQEEPSIYRDFGRLLRLHDRASNTVVGSFHHRVLSAFRQVFPEYTTSATPREVVRFLMASRIGTTRRWGSRPWPRALQVPERSGPLRITKPRFIRGADRAGIALQVWTVNEPAKMRQLLLAGVDGIVTDRPDLLLEVLGK